ncbi:thiolase family protein [Candidatus Hydrogenedentota bacterium]
MEEAVIVSGVRTAVGKATRGTLRHTRPDELAAICLTEAVEHAKGPAPKDIDDVLLGCSFPEKEQGMNLGRISAMRAGFPHSVSGATVNRFCSSGLQTIAMASERIMAGGADIILAGGAESMSAVPTDASMRMAPNPNLAENYPDLYLAMGLTAENVAEEFNVSREESDQFAFNSHKKALAAIKEGRFEEEVVPVAVKTRKPAKGGGIEENEVVFRIDECPRVDTSLEALGQLRPVFKLGGQVTAGNSSQTSDGSAFVLVMSKTRAEELGLKPMAVFRGFTVAGVRPEVMGIGPVEAIPKLLKRTGVDLTNIDLIELNEAFACQALAVMRELGLPEDKVNVNGGAVALGHPLGCTGAKLTVTLLHELRRRGGGLGLVSMCVGGGMGAAALFEVTKA